MYNLRKALPKDHPERMLCASILRRVAAFYGAAYERGCLSDKMLEALIKAEAFDATARGQTVVAVKLLLATVTRAPEPPHPDAGPGDPNRSADE